MRFNQNMSRGLRSMLLMAALMVASAGAMANQFIEAPNGASTWTVYAFGNAQAVSDAFRALNNFAASSTFQSIVGFIAILGMLGVGISSGFSSAVARKFIGYAVSVFLVCYIFFGVGSGGPIVVRVEVQDTVDGTWTTPVTVPMVVGIPASVISTAGYEITRQIEASFMIPDELKMSNGAPFNLAAALISDAGKARITDSNLASSLAYYVQDCFTIAVARGQLSASTLLNSTDFINDIKVNMPGVYVNTLLQAPAGVPNVVSCPTAWTLINAAVNAQGNDAASFLKSASAWAKTPAMSVVNAAADSVAQWATNNGVTDGGALIKQSAVLAAFNGAFRQTAAATGNSDFLTGLALTQAHEAQVSGWITGAEVFNRIMGYVFAVLQVFVYALTPLVLAAALVPGLGFALLKNFGQILLWLAIWQPMLAIINFIIISMQQADLGGVLNSGMGNFGFTLNNMGIISEKTANMRAAATFVGTMVPALAWALVKGSVDFSRVIGSAVGEQFGQQAANTISTGNYSLNQASMDSFTANKHSVGHTGDWGFGNVSTGQGGMMQKHELGGMAGVASGDQAARLQVASTLGANAGGQLASNASNLIGGSTSLAGAYGGNLVTAATDSRFGGYQDASVDGTSANGSLSVNGAQLMGPANNPQGKPALPGSPAAARAGMPGMPGAETAPIVKPGNPIADGAKAVVRAVNPTVQLAKQYSRNHMNTAGAQEQLATTGSRSRSGTLTYAGTDSANAGDTASESMGYQKGLNQQVTGISSLSDRVEAVRPALQFESDLYADYYGAKGSADYEYARGTGTDSVSKQAAEVAKPNAVQNAVEGVKSDVEDEKARLEAEAAARHKKGESEAEKGLAAPNSVINKVKGDLPGLVAKSRTPASALAIRDGKEVINEAGEKVAPILAKGREWANKVIPAAAAAVAAPKGNAPAPAVKPDTQPHSGSDHTLRMPFAQPKPVAPSASAKPTGEAPKAPAAKPTEEASTSNIGSVAGVGSLAGVIPRGPASVSRGGKINDLSDYNAEPVVVNPAPSAAPRTAALPGAGRDSGPAPQANAQDVGRDANAAQQQGRQPEPQGTNQVQQLQPQPQQQQRPGQGNGGYARDGQEQDPRAVPVQAVTPDAGRDANAAQQQGRQPEPQGISQGQQLQQQPQPQQPQRPGQGTGEARDGQEQDPRAVPVQAVTPDAGRDANAAQQQGRQQEPQGTSQGQQLQQQQQQPQQQQQQPQQQQQQPQQQQRPGQGNGEARDGQEQDPRAVPVQAVTPDAARDANAAQQQGRQQEPQGTSQGQQLQQQQQQPQQQQRPGQGNGEARDGQEQDPRAVPVQAVTPDAARDANAAQQQGRQQEPQGTSQGQQLQQQQPQQPQLQQPQRPSQGNGEARDGQEQDPRAVPVQAVTPDAGRDANAAQQQGRQQEPQGTSQGQQLQQQQNATATAERQLQGAQPVQAAQPGQQQAKPVNGEGMQPANQDEIPQVVAQRQQQAGQPSQAELQKREGTSVAATGESSDPRVGDRERSPAGNQPTNENGGLGQKPEQANQPGDRTPQPAQEGQQVLMQQQQQMQPQVPQPPQPPQMPQPPQAMEPQPSQAPQQPAAAPINQDGIPDPFSGKPSQENAGQAQVQLAEQRAERLTNQIRTADTLLAGAENQKPEELRETVREVQDQLRRT